MPKSSPEVCMGKQTVEGSRLAVLEGSNLVPTDVSSNLEYISYEYILYEIP